MGLSKYNVNVNGTTATLRLSDADAKARGLTSADLVNAPKRTAAPKAKPATTKAAPAPLNKSRTAATTKAE